MNESNRNCRDLEQITNDGNESTGKTFGFVPLPPMIIGPADMSDTKVEHHQPMANTTPINVVPKPFFLGKSNLHNIDRPSTIDIGDASELVSGQPKRKNFALPNVVVETETPAATTESLVLLHSVAKRIEEVFLPTVFRVDSGDKRLANQPHLFRQKRPVELFLRDSAPQQPGLSNTSMAPNQIEASIEQLGQDETRYATDGQIPVATVADNVVTTGNQPGRGNFQIGTGDRSSVSNFDRVGTCGNVTTNNETHSRNAWPLVSSELVLSHWSKISALGQTVFPRNPTAMNRVVITSTHRGEGKTTIAISLARWASMGQRRTLLVDADIHNPQIVQLIKCATDVSWQDLDCVDPIRQAVTMFGNPAVGIMPLHRSTTHAESVRQIGMLPIQRLSHVLDQMERHFDCCIIDAGLVVQLRSFGESLAELASSAVLVSDVNVTSDNQFAESVDALANAKISRIAVAENFCDEMC